MQKSKIQRYDLLLRYKNRSYENGPKLRHAIWGRLGLLFHIYCFVRADVKLL